MKKWLMVLPLIMLMASVCFAETPVSNETLKAVPAQPVSATQAPAVKAMPAAPAMPAVSTMPKVSNYLLAQGKVESMTASDLVTEDNNEHHTTFSLSPTTTIYDAMGMAVKSVKAGDMVKVKYVEDSGKKMVKAIYLLK